MRNQNELSNNRQVCLIPIFLDRKAKLKPHQAVIATFRMRNQNELSNNRQVCLIPNSNSKSSAILGRCFSLTQSGLFVSMLLNTEATTVTIQRGKKLGYVLPLNTDYQSVEKFKRILRFYAWSPVGLTSANRYKQMKTFSLQKIEVDSWRPK